MTSVFFKLNPYVVLEYQYNSKIINSSSSKFKKISNSYSGIDIIVNDDNSLNATNNTTGDTIVEISDDRSVLLGKNSAFYYPDIDNNIQVSDINPISYDVVYDRVRLHILSGYNFDNLLGFMTSIYLRTQKNGVLKLSNFLFDKGKKELIYFNPKPLRFVDFIYDKYIEYYVPSPEFLINQQIGDPNNPNILSALFTQDKLAITKNIYCEFNTMSLGYVENGIDYLKTIEGVKISFNTTDDFDKLTAYIRENDEKGYFEYAAMYDGNPIEDYIYKLNSLAGNKFILIHDLIISEQLGETFLETDNFNIVQQDKFNDVRRIRPVMRYSDTATSLNIDYMVRLYDQNTGRSIFKRASISTLNTRMYGDNRLKINVGNVTQPIKVYNKRYDNAMSIKDNVTNMIQTKVTYVYVNNNDITLSQNNVETYQIEITPFDNLFKFNLLTLNNGVKTQLQLDSSSRYYIVFTKNDDTKYNIEEYKSAEFNKNEGQLAFKISKQQSSDISKFTDRYFYITSKNVDGIETVLFKGIYTI